MSMHYEISGILTIKQTSHLCYGRVSRMTTPVTPGPPETAADHPKGSRKGKKENNMSNPPKNPAGPTLADVDREVAKNESLSATRRRDLRSAVSRVAALLGEEPAHLPLELETIAARLATINAGRRGDDAEDARQRPLRLPGRRSTQRSATGAGLGQNAVVAGLGRVDGAVAGQAPPPRPLAAGALRQRCRCRSRRDQ